MFIHVPLHRLTWSWALIPQVHSFQTCRIPHSTSASVHWRSQHQGPDKCELSEMDSTKQQCYCCVHSPGSSLCSESCVHQQSEGSVSLLPSMQSVYPSLAAKRLKFQHKYSLSFGIPSYNIINLCQLTIKEHTWHQVGSPVAILPEMTLLYRSWLVGLRFHQHKWLVELWCSLYYHSTADTGY